MVFAVKEGGEGECDLPKQSLVAEIIVIQRDIQAIRELQAVSMAFSG